MDKSARIRIFIIIFISILVVWVFARSCTGDNGEKEMWRVARDPNWFPLNISGKEKNLLAFTNDLLGLIACEYNQQFSLLFGRSSELFEGLDLGRYDAIITTTSPSVILLSKYDFSDPFYLTGPVIVVREDSSIKTIDQLEGKIVGIEAGSSMVFASRSFPEILFTSYTNRRAILDRLIDDQIDAVVMDAIPAYVFVQSYYAGKVKIAGQPLTDDGLRIVVRRGERGKQFIDQFNKGLKRAIDDGTYEKLIKKWNLFETKSS